VTKTSGLGDGLIFGSADMSGDVQQLNSLSTPRSTFDFTGIDKKAMERQTGTVDGLLSMTTFFNPGAAANAAHLVARTLPRTDVQLAYLRGTTLGSQAFCILGKQINYDASRGADGSLTFAVTAQANGFHGLNCSIRAPTTMFRAAPHYCELPNNVPALPTLFGASQHYSER